MFSIGKKHKVQILYDINALSGESPTNVLPQIKDADQFQKILDKFFDFITKEKGDRTSLTLYDLFPGEVITEDLVYDLVYYCATHVDTFGFKKERQIYGNFVKDKPLEQKREILRARRRVFFGDARNKNKILPILHKLWDNTPDIMMVTKLHRPSKKHLGDRPKNLEEFVQKFAHEHTNKLDPKSRIIRCSFAQTIIAIVRALDADMLDKADKELALIVKKIRRIEGLEITEEGAGYIKFLYKGSGITYSGKFLYRMKALQKIILKILYNRVYTDINDQSDLGGIRLVLNENPNTVLAQEERIHASKTFGQIIYPDKDERVKVRVKGEYLGESSLKELLKNDKIIPRSGEDKSATGNMQNISFISTKPDKNLEFQIESPGNMDTYFESPEFNNVKKILASASRAKKGINTGNLMLAIYLLCPEQYNKKTIVNHLICKNKMMIGYKPRSDDLFFMSTDIYTKEYNSQYDEEVFTPIDLSIAMSVIYEIIDQTVKERNFKDLVRKMKEYLLNAEKALASLSLSSMIS